MSLINRRRHSWLSAWSGCLCLRPAFRFLLLLGSLGISSFTFRFGIPGGCATQGHRHLGWQSVGVFPLVPGESVLLFSRKNSVETWFSSRDSITLGCPLCFDVSLPHSRRQWAAAPKQMHTRIHLGSMAGGTPIL